MCAVALISQYATCRFKSDSLELLVILNTTRVNEQKEPKAAQSKSGRSFEFVFSVFAS